MKREKKLTKSNCSIFNIMTDKNLFDLAHAAIGQALNNQFGLEILTDNKPKEVNIVKAEQGIVPYLVFDGGKLIFCPFQALKLSKAK